MKRAYLIMPLVGAMLCIALAATAQQPDTTLAKLQNLPSGYLSDVNAKINTLNNQITQKSQQALSHMQAEEVSINTRLTKIDSVAALNLFTNSLSGYQTLQNKIQAKTTSIMTGIPGGSYFPYLDTLKNTLSFLNRYSTVLSSMNNEQSKLQTTLGNLNQLEYRIQSAQQVELYISDREALLTQALSKYGTLFNGQLLGINKINYYFSEQTTSLEQIFSNPKQAETQALNILRTTSVFNNFMQKNSMLAGFFDVPAGYGTHGLTGLQTLTMVQQQIQSKIAGAGPAAANTINQQIQGAMSQLEQMKSFPGLTSTAQMPNFTPNPMKTKTLLSRLEYGTNIQFQNGSTWYPSTATIGVQLAYKLNANSSAGVGMAYVVGMGTDYEHISFSSQGISLRSFLDWRLKGSFFVNGGLERDFNESFESLHDLYSNVSLWNTCALLGISKQYQLSAKMNGSVMILYDFLYRSHVPPTPPFSFRTGYNF